MSIITDAFGGIGVGVVLKPSICVALLNLLFSLAFLRARQTLGVEFVGKSALAALLREQDILIGVVGHRARRYIR